MPVKKLPGISNEHVSGAFKDPTTKANLLDRMMSYDFSGDIKDLAKNRDLKMERVKPNVIKLSFGDSGQSFELSVRKPRGPRPVAEKETPRATRAKRTQRHASSATNEDANASAH